MGVGRAGAPGIGGVAPGKYVVVSGIGFLVGMPELMFARGGTPIYVAKGGGPVGVAGVATDVEAPVTGVVVALEVLRVVAPGAAGGAAEVPTLGGGSGELVGVVCGGGDSVLVVVTAEDTGGEAEEAACRLARRCLGFIFSALIAESWRAKSRARA
jgi:hypothetical protein